MMGIACAQPIDLLPGMLQGEDEYTVIGGLYEVNIAAY
jgi:hypothetical protein